MANWKKLIARAINPYSELDPDLQIERLKRRISELQEHLLFPVGLFKMDAPVGDNAVYVQKVQKGGARYFVHDANTFQAYALVHAQYAADDFTNKKLITRILDMDHECGAPIFALFDEVLRLSVHKFEALAEALWKEASALEVGVKIADQQSYITYLSTGRNIVVYINGFLAVEDYKPFALKTLKQDTTSILGWCVRITSARNFVP